MKSHTLLRPILALLFSASAALCAAELPVLRAGHELQPGWQEQVRLLEDPAAHSGQALVLRLEEETGKETGIAYWGHTLAGLITHAPEVRLEPGRRYRAWVRMRVAPNIGSGSALTLYMSTDGTAYMPQVTWRNVRRYYGFQFPQAGVYHELPLDFTTGAEGVVRPEIRVINIGPLADHRSTGGGELEEIALATIRFEDLTPPVAIEQVRAGQSHYRRADEKSVTIALRNHTAAAQEVTLRAALLRDLDLSTALADRQMTLAPGERREFTLPLPGNAEFGHEVLAEALLGGEVVDRASDIFTVSDNVYKVQMWVSQGPTNAPALCWSGAVDMSRVPELVESMRAACGNFYEFFAWPPCDGLDFVPAGERWWAGQNGYPQSKSNLQGIIRELHRHGLKAFMYAAWWSCGTGMDIFRRQPDWFLYESDTGRAGGCDIAAYKQARDLIAQGQEGIGLQRSGGGASPNWADPRVVDAGLDSMRESIRMFGWDGVRWDGEYQMTFYWDKMDIHGRLVKDLYGDLDATNTRILRQIIERFQREEPQFVWGYNNDMNLPLWGDNPPAALRYKLAQGGSIMWESPREAGMPTNPNHSFAEYSRNTVEMADYSRERGGYFMQFPAGHGWVGTVHDRVYKTIIPVVGNSTVYGNTAFLADTLGEYNRFIARYSALWWGDEVRSVRDPQRFLRLDSSAPVWWEDYVDVRPAPGGARDLIIHLVNEPVQKEIGPDPVGLMPPLQTDLTLRLGPEFGGAVTRAWFLTPEPTITTRELPLEQEGGAWQITVPRLQCWSVVVLRVEGGRL